MAISRMVMGGAALGAVLLSACGGPSGGAAGNTADVGEDAVCTAERGGGSVTVGTFLEPQGLDPLGQPGNAVTGGTEITALYDTLVSWDPETASYVPRVAESVEPNAAYTIWTVQLRPDIRFGNGDPLTAESVAASIERHRSPDNAQVSAGEVKSIQSITVRDDRTLAFQLSEPYPDFPHVLATDVGMITNPNVVDAVGPEQFATNPKGSGVGPYELERYAPGEEIVLKAKDDYWGGPVCIDELRFVRLSGAQATLDALQQGELDVAFLREPQVIDQARESNFRDLSTLINFGEAVIMNSAAGPSSDPRIRRAVVEAIDPSSLNDRVFDGTAAATSALVAEGTSGLEPTEGPPHQLDEAKSLVEQAKDDGFDGSIRLIADNSPTRVQESIAVAAMLEAAGFDVELDNTSTLSDVITKVVVDRDYDLAIWGPQFFSEGTWSIMNRVLDSASASYYGYSNPKVDSALKQLKMSTSPQERSAVLGELQSLLNEDPFAANFAAIEEAWSYGARVHGLRQDRGSIIRFDEAFVTE